LVIARAYFNHGRWVADCPREYCSYAFELEPGQDRYLCRTKQRRAGVPPKGCGADAPIEWPTDAGEIQRVLEMRPVEATQNWFPEGHALAVAAGLPHGQSVADLLGENEEHGVKGMR
jgi:hypothetical protein